MIVIVDYGMGNLRSVEKALEKLGYHVQVTSKPEVVQKAAGLVLPGVGAFADCMQGLAEHGLINPIKEFLSSGRPFLGICLGLQVLFEESEEDGLHKGLSIFKGKVVKLPEKQKVPHMGWNQIKIVKRAPIFQQIPDNSHFYFVHSYYVSPKETDIVATKTEYGIEFVSSVWRQNIFALQFHPEKSSQIGLKILANFGRLCLGNISGN
jgi:glutamine amidotransferase